MEDKQISTHNLYVDFGRYKGERWTRVPVGYLRWCINEMSPERETHKIARTELARRGDTAPTGVEISNHAIDRASLRLQELWQSDKHEDEGLYSWLVRICDEALAASGHEKPERIACEGYVLVFAYGNEYPTLKTVLAKRAY